MSDVNTNRLYSIRQKLTAMNMLVSGAALLLACTAFASYELKAFRESIVRNISIQAQIAGANSASALLFNDPEAARDTLSALNAAPYVLSAGIYSPDGKEFAMWSRSSEASEVPRQQELIRGTETHVFTRNALILVRAVEFQGKLVGMVRIQSDLAEISDRLFGFAGIVTAVLLMSLLAAFAFSAIFQETTARPIAQLAETARVISRDKSYDVRAPLTTNAVEIVVLIQAFNQMLGQIELRDAALRVAREQLELRVAMRTAQLEAVNRELESFTYSVAHDLRAPLRHIQGFIDALMEDCARDLTSEAHAHLSRIVESTRRMDQLITDLLALAHVGRQELNLKVTDLTALVQDVIRDLAVESGNRRIDWRIGKLPVVACDPGLMKLAFQNLLANAIKYTRPRDPAIIEIAEKSMDGQNVIFVRDNGVGFNMKYAHKLFGVFERLHRREDFEGTGVGLATVQRIVHKHGGKIWAQAEVDRGATFFVVLGPATAEGLPPIASARG